MELSSKVFFYTESCLADLALEKPSDATLASLSMFDIFKMVSKMEARNSKINIFTYMGQIYDAI